MLNNSLLISELPQDEQELKEQRTK